MGDETTADVSERILRLCDQRGSPPTPEEMHEAFASLETDHDMPAKSEELSFAALRFRRALWLETDRGAALYAAAFLDARLEVLLRAYFVQREDVASKLLAGNGGLSTFSARIDSALLLGLLSQSTWRDLHLLRKIRNDFAHSPDAIDFSHDPIASRCHELGHTPLVRNDRARTRYIQAVMGVAGEVDTVVTALLAGRRKACVEASGSAPDPAKMREIFDAFLLCLLAILEKRSS